MVGLIIFLASIALSFTTGLIVFIKNPRQKPNILYGLTTISYVLLSVSNFLSLYAHGSAKLTLVRLVMVFSSLSVASTYYLIVAIIQQDGTVFNRLLYWAGIVFTVVVAFLGLSNVVIAGLAPYGASERVIAGAAMPLFLVQMCIFVVAIIWQLLSTIFSKGRANKHRVQFIYMLLGVIPVFVLAPITGIYMPLVNNDLSLIFLTPIYSTFFVIMVGYAILKHRLFDIRPIIARLFGYFLSLLIISVLFVSISLSAGFVLVSGDVPISTLAIFTGISLLTVAIFQPLKKSFDRFTTRIFYRDMYIAQDVINSVNSVIVSNTNISKLLETVTSIIERDMNISFCAIRVESGLPSGKDVVKGGNLGISENTLGELSNLARKHKQPVLYREDERLDQRVRAELELSNMQALIKMSSNDEVVGTAIFGYKKSGDILSKSDLQILKIIADEVAIAVQNALRFQEISEFNLTLQRRVEDATKELRKTNDKLKKLDETKDEFISMASHQLRTPLTSVKGYLSMVLEGDAGELNDLQRQLLGQSYSSSQRMVYLISDLLNLSRLNTGKFVIEPAEVDLREVVAAEIDQLRETAKSRGVSIVYNAPQSFPVLMLDETKTHQVVMNFLDNAIYYTPTGGEVHVSLVETATAVEYRVKDSGIGVPRSEQHRLFSKFYRAENARRVRPDGTGLGLFMSKKVVVAQGGSIIFESEEGKGSTFGFRFGKAGHAVAPPRPNQQ